MSNAIIEQIIANADIVKIIGKHVELKRAGNEFRGCCPFHGEKSPSFFVNPAKGLYHCFGCGAGGNALTFLKEQENLTAGEALQELSRQTGIELPKDSNKNYAYKKRPRTTPQHATQNPAQNLTSIAPPASYDSLATHAPQPNAPQHLQAITPAFDAIGQAVADGADFDIPFDTSSASTYTASSGQPLPTNDDNFGNLYDLLTQVSHYYQQQLMQHPLAYQYLLDRGLTPQTISEFGLGYAPSSSQHLHKAFARDIEGLKILKLITPNKDRAGTHCLLYDRVIFPIRDQQGRVVGFAGRTMADINPKYINSSESPVFYKKQQLYGLYEGRKAKAKNWLVVEGYMDVISLHQAGVYGAVASMGTAVTTAQLERLLTINPCLTLSFDGDSAGQRAAWRAMEQALPVLSDGRELRFLTLPDNHDPDSFVKAFGKEAMLRQIEQAIPLSQYLFSVLSRRYELSVAEGRSKLLAEVRTLTNQLPKGSYSWVLREDMRQRLGLGQRKQARSAQDALLNFNSLLTVQMQLQLCFLYQPQLLAYEEGATATALLDAILEQSGANKLPLFNLPSMPNADNNRLTEEENQARFTELLRQHQQRTEQHLANNPMPPLGWQDVLDESGYQLLNWIQQHLPAIMQCQQQLETMTTLDDYELINAKAHFILAGLPPAVQKPLLARWLAFFMEFSRREVIDLTILVTEMLTGRLLEALQKRKSTGSDLVTKQLYARQITVINQWYQAWLQQLDDFDKAG